MVQTDTQQLFSKYNSPPRLHKRTVLHAFLHVTLWLQLRVLRTEGSVIEKTWVSGLSALTS